MSQIKEILSGWGNLLLQEFDLLEENIKVEGERRLNICNGCPLREGNKCNPIVSGPAVVNFRYNQTGEDRIKGLPYQGCGCKLSAKTVSPESQCPLGRWEVQDDSTTEDIK